MRCWLSSPQHGLPLLLIHGYGAVVEHWQRVLPLLQQHHTPCAFDLYNFGESARLNVPAHKEVWVAQTVQVLTDLLATPAVVIGHSMGGMVAAQLAKTHPHLVRGLVLVNSAGLPVAKPAAPFGQDVLGMTFGMTNLPGVSEMLSGFSSVTGSWGVYQGLLSSYYRKDRVTPDLVEAFSKPLRKSGCIQAYMAVSREFDSYVLDIQPGEVEAPVFIAWGAEDYAMPPFMANMFQQDMFPQATVQIIPQTGHSPFDEAPEAFAAALLPWLSTL
jgi:pimeloyl-ACP methyl ester carboxylesterase